MLGKYKAVLALLLLIILVPLTLLMTLGLWVPTLAGIWLPLGTRIALDESPRITRKGLIIPDLRYLVGDCQLAHITNASLSHPSRWLLNVWDVKSWRSKGAACGRTHVDVLCITVRRLPV